MADQMAKTEARDEDMSSFSRIPMSTLSRELQEKSNLKFKKKTRRKAPRQLKQNDCIQTSQNQIKVS